MCELKGGAKPVSIAKWEVGSNVDVLQSNYYRKQCFVEQSARQVGKSELATVSFSPSHHSSLAGRLSDIDEAFRSRSRRFAQHFRSTNRQQRDVLVDSSFRREMLLCLGAHSAMYCNFLRLSVVCDPD